MKRTQEFYFSDHPLGDREWPIGTAELARYFKVSSRTIFNWRAKGKIPFWRVNPRVLRYVLSDVEKALGKPPNE
jgi:excisionase family DNA binding protein